MTSHRVIRRARGHRWLWTLLAWVAVVSAQAPEEVPVTRQSRIAILPTVNLSANLAPMGEVMQLIHDQADLRGLNSIDDATLRAFMARHRMRYTGGLMPRFSPPMAAEIEADVVLITSLHSFNRSTPPTFAMSARLVSTDDLPRILWMEEIGLTGDQKPGLLSMGLVRDVDVLRDRVIERVFDSLTDWLGSTPSDRLPPLKAQNRFRPKRFYRTPERPESPGARFRVAILPFINDSARRNADEVLMEQFAFRFWETKRVEVLEPGIVRSVLLENRLIRDEGLTLTQIYVLSGELNIDLIVSGDVSDYLETTGFGGNPVVTFTSRAIDARRGLVSWTAISTNRGSDGTGLFAFGSVRGGHTLASQMIRAVVATALDPKGKRENKVLDKPANER
jgi:hypothetical protein